VEEEFNVSNPTKDSIDHAFKNLIFYVTASASIDIYKNQKERFEDAIVKIRKIIAQYINEKDLLSISEEMLQEVKFDLIDLDVQTKHLESYYAEWSLLWLDAVISLRMSVIQKTGGENNVRNE